MSIEEFINENDFFIPLRGVPLVEVFSQNQSISLTDPNNVFELQNAVSDKLNKFQTNYGRYIKCQDPSTSSNLKPACGNKDNFNNVTISYYDLLDAIDKLNGSYAEQKKVAKAMDEKTFQDTVATITAEYAEMIELRKTLDAQLAALQYNLKNGPESPKQRLDSTIFGYVLWIILATCLIYFVFI